ncbi:MAG: homoserine dehydrogenase [Thermodesulfobacteriota bacterium]
MKLLKKRLILCGFGKVGKAFATLLAERKHAIGQKYGMDMELAAVVDIGGAAVSREGPLPIDGLLSHAGKGGMVETFPGYGIPGISGTEAISSLKADVLVETTPTDLTDGQPGRGHMEAALKQGLDIVSANKGPLVLFYRELQELAQAKGRRIFMSAATAAALPTLDVGMLCLAGSQVISIEGILTGTANYILTRMYQDKCAYDVALREAQEMGIAETDPSLDVEGWDTRNKLFLIANRIFEKSIDLGKIRVTGITGVSAKDMEKAQADGKVIKLVGTALLEKGTLALRVEPQALATDHPLASVHYSEKGISYLTDTMGRVTVIGGKSSPMGAAAALIKDLIHSSLISPP